MKGFVIAMILGAQLFTLRDYLKTEEDIEKTLNRVAEMGYKTVQISGVGPIEPKKLRGICDGLDLKIVLTHTPQNRIINETEQVIEEHNILGADYIGLGMMAEEYHNIDGYNEFKKLIKPAVRKIADAGKLFMYHNHNFEFEKYDGKLLFDRLIDDFAPDEMGFTMDTYWIQAGGGDVVAWIEKLAGRIPVIHLKDMKMKNWTQTMEAVMEGNLNFPPILKAAEKAGVKWAMVEQDFCDKEQDPFERMQTSLNNLKKFGYR